MFINRGLTAVALLPWTAALIKRTVFGMDKYQKIIELFSKRVRKLRLEHGFSQEDFASQAEIDRSYYGRIERGDANPTLKNIAAIAETLGISIQELFGESPKRVRRKKSTS